MYYGTQSPGASRTARSCATPPGISSNIGIIRIISISMIIINITIIIIITSMLFVIVLIIVSALLSLLLDHDVRGFQVAVTSICMVVLVW